MDNPLDFERLLTLSCGLIRGQKWDQALDALQLFEIKDDEVIFRVAFCQDPHEEANRFRSRIMNQLKTLSVLIADTSQFPKTISSLTGTCELKYTQDNAPANLISLNGGSSAFVAYIGCDGTPGDRQQLYERMVSFCSSTDASRGRVVLWYQDGAIISKIYDTTQPTVTKDFSEPPQSVVKESL